MRNFEEGMYLIEKNVKEKSKRNKQESERKSQDKRMNKIKKIDETCIKWRAKTQMSKNKSFN